MPFGDCLERNSMPLCEVVERKLQDFEKERSHLEAEIFNMKESIKKSIDDLFEKIVQDLNPHLEETDTILENCIKEFRRLDARKKEIKTLKDQLGPVLELFGRTN